MASIYDNIRSTLEDKLVNAVGATPIAWENIDFKPTTGTSFIKPQFIPTLRRPAVRGLLPQQRYDGLYTVFCYTPENVGPGAADDLADSIIETFEATTDISYSVDTNTTLNLSIDYAEREQGRGQPPWYYVVVNIGWYIYNG
jgi:hypothetical protein